MRGVLGWSAYLPYRRLDRREITAFVGQGGGRGTRTVASFDEDPTTMAVAAAQHLDTSGLDVLLFATGFPAYADKTNATAIHAALQLPPHVPALDLGSATRSALGGVLLAARSSGTTLVAAADIRTGWAGSTDEAAGGDAAAAVLIGEATPERRVVADVVATASVTDEFIDRWRAPGEVRTKVWDDKFAETTYARLARSAWAQALTAAGLSAEQVDVVAVAAPTSRIAASIAANLGVAKVVDDLSATVGNSGVAQPLVLLAALLEQAEPDRTVALVGVADGADVILLRTTSALAERRGPTLAAQVAAGGPLGYGKFLGWREMLKVEPPRRPEPARVSATAAARRNAWKFGLVAARDPRTGSIHMPPQRVSSDGTRIDQMEPLAMATTSGVVATFTIDRMAYSPSPPVVFAVVDFDGGGRLPIELCDVDAADVHIGMRVEPTFRRLYVQDGIPNYFWKARPERG